MTRLSTWGFLLFFAAFSVFSIKVKRDVARAEALDAFEGAVSYGEAPPAFELESLDGTIMTLESQVEDGHLVLLNFWATWCPPCRLEMPVFEQLHHEYADRGLRIVAVDVGEDRETVFEFVQDRSFTFPVLLDRDEAVATRYRINAFPTSLILDDAGEVVGIIEGLDPYLSYRIQSHLEDYESEAEPEREAQEDEP